MKSGLQRGRGQVRPSQGHMAEAGSAQSSVESNLQTRPTAVTGSCIVNARLRGRRPEVEHLSTRHSWLLSLSQSQPSNCYNAEGNIVPCPNPEEHRVPNGTEHPALAHTNLWSGMDARASSPSASPRTAITPGRSMSATGVRSYKQA